MKKLMALIVIIMLTASIVVAEKFDNPFKFSLYNQIKLKAKDESQMGRMWLDSNGEDSEISYAPDYDFVVTKTFIEDEMQCKASITLAEIYTMAFWLRGIGGVGDTDADFIEFRVGMDNGIQVVQDFLKIDINIHFRNKWKYGTHVDYQLLPFFKLSGKIPVAGIDWGIQEEVEMKWNPENWKDQDPLYETFDGDAYDPDTGNRVDYGDMVGDSTQAGSFEYVKFSSKVYFNIELFHYFAPDNVSGKIKLSNNFKVKLPYSYYLELDKTINDEFEAGFELGLAGPSVYLAFWGETEDKLNTSAPLNGDYGSHGSWEGVWLGNEGNLEDGASWVGDWDDFDATYHGRPNLKIGFKLNFSYSKEWFKFGTEYKGYETGIRKYDEDRLNNELKWVNEFNIYAKFSL